MTFPRYPDYKDSGVEWLGETPKHWDIKRLKRICRAFPSNVDKKSYDDQSTVNLCNYVDVYHNDEITTSLSFMEATASRDEIAKFTLMPGDTIITKDSETADDIAVAAYVPEKLPGVVCGYHLTIVRPSELMFGRFVKRLFDSQFLKAQFAVAANGLTRVGLSQYAIDNALLTAPPLPEQISIVAFLDRETAKIDALVTEQERLIELLNEKRRAVISHAVTKGLNSQAPMKDSGVEWLGEVPQHWDIVRLKFLAQVRSGVAKGRNLDSEKTIKVPYLRVANVQDGYLDLDDVATIDVTEPERDRYALAPGDVLMNEGGDFDKLGRGHIWRGEIDGCIHQNHVFAVRPMTIESEWLTLLSSADCGRYYFMSRSKQSTNLASISSTNIGEFALPVPPDWERAAIVQYVASEKAKIDTLITESQRAIELLKERRSALISAAVTGKIDVRGLAAVETETEAA